MQVHVLRGGTGCHFVHRLVGYGALSMNNRLAITHLVLSLGANYTCMFMLSC